MPEVVIDYRPNRVQEQIHALVQTVRFLIVACHRGAGKSWGAANLCLDVALFSGRAMLVVYLGPFRNQVKAIIWEYFKKLCADIPGIEWNETELRIDFPNGSRITLAGADGVDHLRGLHLDLVVLDEPAFMPPEVWPTVVRPMLSARHGRGLFVGTFLSRQNHFWQLYDRAGSLPEWGRLLVRASESGIHSAAELASARASMSEEQYLREYELECSNVLDGSIYGKLLDAMEKEGRLGNVPWNPAVPVWTAWDIGVSDSTAIWFLQPDGKGWNAIDYEEHSGAGMSFYVKLLKEKPYTYQQHVGPHDLSVQEFGSGLTRLETARDLGIDFTLAPRQSVEDGIDAVRNLLPQLWIDRSKCARGVEALQDYRYTWDETLRIFSRRPFHNWAAHACDSLRYFATGHDDDGDEDYEAPPSAAVRWNVFTGKVY